MHERALAIPMQWAALSERMLMFQDRMPPHAAVLHLEAAAAMVSAAFRVDTRRDMAQRHAEGAEARKLTGNGVSARSGVRDRIWLLRHLRAFADTFPKELMTLGRSTEHSARLASPKHLRSLWLVKPTRLQPRSCKLLGTAIFMLRTPSSPMLMLRRLLRARSAHG